MKELHYCKICHETYEIEHEHVSSVKLPESCKSKTGECFLNNKGKPCSKLMQPNEQINCIRNYIYGGVLALLIFFMVIILVAVLTSCNFSVNLVHCGTEGSIDEVDEASPDVKPNVNLTSVPGV